MNSFAEKAARYAKDAVKLAPGEKESQWILQKAAGHAAWDWNISNHTSAINFYRDIVEENPDTRLPYMYLIDNLITDHRADEAEYYLERLSRLKDTRPVINEVYRAHIALARFDEPKADQIIENLLQDNPEDFNAMFEAAQYYAEKCDYQKAIDLYEKSFAAETRRPRFTDELMGIADIYQIMGDYQKAADTYDRILDLLKNEWGMTEDTAIKDAEKIKAELLSKTKQA